MVSPLHLTSGDICGSILAKCDLPGEVFVWHDILYDGPREPGWPSLDILQGRARFLEHETGGGLAREMVLATLKEQYRKIEEAAASRPIVLWFDACLFDQSMLAHILTCLRLKGAQSVELICVDAFPGVDPYDGLGQLTPAQLAPFHDHRRPVTEAQFSFAAIVDAAFAAQDKAVLRHLAALADAPLPWVPAAVTRWLAEWPDPETGLGRLQTLALAAMRNGAITPAEVLAAVRARDSHPHYWGEVTLWVKINALADKNPPLVNIEGPAPRLPQWGSLGGRVTQLRPAEGVPSGGAGPPAEHRASGMAHKLV